MELKRDLNRVELKELSDLLIVPYGIETFLPSQCVQCHELLIVPYGIETR